MIHISIVLSGSIRKRQPSHFPGIINHVLQYVPDNRSTYDLIFGDVDNTFDPAHLDLSGSIRKLQLAHYFINTELSHQSDICYVNKFLYWRNTCKSRLSYDQIWETRIRYFRSTSRLICSARFENVKHLTASSIVY